jgi:N-acyl-D-amino-acid deacylase
MRLSTLLVGLLLIAFGRPATAADVVLRQALVYDGGGGTPYVADVRVHGDRITRVAPHLTPNRGEQVRDVHGLAMAPGFIDMHSHGDVGLLSDLDAGTIARQGVTTIVVGQDGDSNYPLADWLGRLTETPAAINVASMAGQATLRAKVMGKDLYRPSTPEELQKMKMLLAQELAAGAFGLSTGLEYEEAHFATTEEVIELAKVAARAKGFYISHVRDEGDNVFRSYDEVLRIGREAHLPVEISHIKLASTAVWHLAETRMSEYFALAHGERVDLRADVYPYNYWFSTIRVIVPDRDFYNPDKVAAALASNGGAAKIRLTKYVPDPALAGKTVEEIAAIWHVTPVEAYMRIVRETSAEEGKAFSEFLENVIGFSMSEDDVRWFVSRPGIMFCSDGDLHGAHPRGAGSFPRVLGRYVREQRALSLEEAIHKMTALPVALLGLRDRGRIAAGHVADLVLFDPATVIDRSTIEQPEAPPVGIPAVMVGGEWVVEGGEPTGRHPGRALRHGKAAN